jgi:hypothetical protein
MVQLHLMKLNLHFLQFVDSEEDLYMMRQNPALLALLLLGHTAAPRFAITAMF